VSRRVGLYAPNGDTPRAREARSALATALPSAQVGEPDGTGAFEVVVDATEQEAALQQVFDAIAAAGADDEITFLEHPDLPEHWRHRAGRPS
jgi:hypothetical protein